MTALWTSADAASATGGRTTSAWEATGVSIDTRTLQPGDLFVALQAARDGHDFVAQALAKGAAAALVTHVPEGVPQDAPLLIVDEVLPALEALGKAARARTGARVVAITGSVGKTSTKEMLRAMLAPQGKTHASEASYNNHWGVPLTLARMPAETEYAVIEIGMNHPGEIAPLARLARPHVAMVTTVAAAHLEAFGSIEGIAVEKASILEGLEPGGTAILNADIDTMHVLEKASQNVVTHWFGTKAPVWTLGKVHVTGSATTAEAAGPGGPLLFKLSSPGAHFAMNGLGALAASTALGADLARSVLGLAAWTPYKGRGTQEVIQLDPADPDAKLTLFDDSYNANPASLEAALNVLAAATPTAKGRRIAYIGDMKELGTDEAAIHASVAKMPAMEALSQLHCIGPLARHLHDALPPEKRGAWSETAAGMTPHLASQVGAGDVVLVKASLSTGLGRLVDALRKLGHPPAMPEGET
ncbi:UDP-N-acetylmuramoyl-tripeptide--D-alanyl-D-alanine ligase [Pseudaestuariivita sp.]|uniref:UDP-N-acetylmuramoyl-tripeptide--D-alanyl-D- alanine ligase n=1 Tax=Pseudaestuariivita sp. TaxID=2211669 RepID=UPI004058F5FE